jgi:hypothetical protein|tara:strand:- start:212 stop:427 length:216 start_codon:yes stop_codon:yes gene_type:complete
MDSVTFFEEVRIELCKRFKIRSDAPWTKQGISERSHYNPAMYADDPRGPVITVARSLEVLDRTNGDILEKN